MNQSPDGEFESNDMPSCAIAIDCQEWMELGIVVVSGHMNGDVRLWSIGYESELQVVHHILPEHA